MVVMVVLPAALALSLSACGDGIGSCGKVQPCGGDVVGTYTIATACYGNATMDMPVIEGCPQATASVTSLGVSGSASFNADRTYAVSETIMGSASQTIPASCLTMDGLTLTCMQLDQLFQQLAAENPEIQSIRCSGSSSCTCTFTLAPMTITESGTYTTSGTTLTLTDTAGGVSSSSYCVQGDELHLLSVDMTMPMGTIQADTVLIKR
jgi:hypothetical protein